MTTEGQTLVKRTTRTFCWACGLADPATPICDECGWGTGAPRSNPDTSIGAVFSLRLRGLRKVPAIVIGRDGDSLALLASKGEVVHKPIAAVAVPVETPWSALNRQSSAWALAEASNAITLKAFAADWDPSKLWERALELAGSSQSELRCFARDALSRRPKWLKSIKISESEKTWLRALSYTMNGDAGSALSEVCQLPVDRYPEKVTVIARCWNALSGFPEVRGHIQAFAGTDQRAAVMLAVLDEKPMRSEEWYEGLLELLEGLEPESHLADLSEYVDVLRTKGIPPGDLSEVAPSLAAMHVVAALRGGTRPASLSSSTVLCQPLSVIDDFIDAGLVDASLLDDLGPEDPRRAYLVARIEPALLGDADLEALPSRSERARRAFLRRDRVMLDEHPDDSHHRAFAQLDDLRNGTPGGTAELELVLHDSELEKARQLSDAISTNSLEPLTPEVLEDPTVWETVLALIPQGAEIPASLKRLREWKALNGAREALFRWDWAAAAEEAKTCLSASDDEAIRDEALNTLACAHYQMGNATAAIQALERAIEGAHTPGLQANIGIVAARLDPKVAATHLARLVMEAPTLRLRAEAAQRAIDIWSKNNEAWTEEGEDESEELPPLLRDALLSLLPEPLSVEQFGEVVKLLAFHAPEALTDADALRGSPNADSLEARIWIARAQGIDVFVEALRDGLRANPDVEWLVKERDQMVGFVTQVLFSDEDSLAGVSFGLMILDSGLPLLDRDRVFITSLSLAGVARSMPANSEPKEELLDQMLKARQLADRLPADDKEAGRGVANMALNSLSAAIAISREGQLNQVVEAYENLINQLNRVGYRQRVNWTAVRQATRPMTELCSDCVRVLNKVLPWITDSDLQQGVTAVRDRGSAILAGINSLRR